MICWQTAFFDARTETNSRLEELHVSKRKRQKKCKSKTWTTDQAKDLQNKYTERAEGFDETEEISLQLRLGFDETEDNTVWSKTEKTNKQTIVHKYIHNSHFTKRVARVFS